MNSHAPLPSTAGASPAEDTVTTIISILADKALLTPNDISPDMALADLGLDSLGMVEAIFAMEEAFDISVPFSTGQGQDGGSVVDTSTVATLIARVEAVIAQKAA
jgi:acyl carrier protein